MLYLAYLQSIPSDYYDAAEVDGASSLQQLFRITLPLLAPAMTVSIVLLVVFGWQVYALPLALTGGGPGTPPIRCHKPSSCTECPTHSTARARR